MSQINTCELHITVAEPLLFISIDPDTIINDELYIEFQILDIITTEHDIPRTINLVHRKLFLERTRFPSEEDVGGHIGSDLRNAGLPETVVQWALESVSTFTGRLSELAGVLPIKICLLQRKDRVNYVYEEDVDVNDVSEEVLVLDLEATVAAVA